MKTFYFILFSLCYFTLSAQQTITESITFGETERTYRLRIPADTDNARPLVFNFHGFGSNALEQEAYSTMNLVADTAGFYVCYPNGIDNAWNVGWDFGSTADDVGFTSALIDTLIANFNINPERIYACGMSNGGFMSYRLACELNDKIAAVASVTGGIAPSYIDECLPGRSIPALEIHGTADDVVPYDGQVNLAVSVETVITYWAGNNGCSGSFIEEDLPNTNTFDGSTVTRFIYTECNADRETWLYRINGGGHTWPGAFITIGITNQDINASEEIWHFFDRYTLNGLTNSTDEVTDVIDLKLFPNPASQQITIESESQIESILFYDLMGKQVLTIASLRGNTIDISELPKGIYFLEVYSSEGKAVKKVVKTPY